MSSKYKNMPIFNIFYFFDIKIFENSQKRSIFKLFWCKNKVYYLDLVFPKKWEVPKQGGVGEGVNYNLIVYASQSVLWTYKIHKKKFLFK